jgi:hypothetical protein
MISSTTNARFSWLLLAGFGFLAAGEPWSARAEEVKVEARLIWGTNEEKSQNPKHKPVDEETSAKLRKIFKWKNYFVETNHTETIPHRQSKKMVMSKDCTIEIQEMAGLPVEVKMFGKGQFINKTTKALIKGEWFVLAGDDKNECAWFVILNRL